MSLWVKNKILSSLEERRNVKRLKLRVAAHEPLDQAIPSQDVPLSGAIIQEKASSYTKRLSQKISRLRMVVYVVGKSEEISVSRKLLENQIP